MITNSVATQRILQQINTWGAVLGLAALFWLNQWHYYLATILATVLISKFGSSIAQHRYFCHRSFQTSHINELILTVLAALSTTGTTIQWVSIHRYHHAHSDIEGDIHSPHDIGMWRSWFHWYTQDPKKLIGPSYVKDLLKKPWIVWQHNNYFLIILMYVIVLACIDPWLVVFCYIVPSGYAMFTSGVLSTPLHFPNQGYRNFETTDRSVNSTVWNWLTLGEGLHNNHHYRAQEYNFAFTQLPGEWDFSAWLIQHFLLKKSNEPS
jgi:stearoyl-CoA desaturase (delta-9 desaturase)